MVIDVLEDDVVVQTMEMRVAFNAAETGRLLLLQIHRFLWDEVDEDALPFTYRDSSQIRLEDSMGGRIWLNLPLAGVAAGDLQVELKERDYQTRLNEFDMHALPHLPEVARQRHQRNLVRDRANGDEDLSAAATGEYLDEMQDWLELMHPGIAPFSQLHRSYETQPGNTATAVSEDSAVYKMLLEVLLLSDNPAELAILLRQKRLESRSE